MNPIPNLILLGQSLWYDNIQRRLLETGELKAMIQRGDIRGVTSNPTIFHNAIAKTGDYDAALTPLAWAGWDAEKIFWQLAIEDIRAACDAFLPLYEETNGGDGFVSLEVSPFLAGDTDATVAQAESLWARVKRPNLMVKIPATPAGVPAIRRAIAAGLNINVTLIFSLQRYAEVMEAYLAGLEDHLRLPSPSGRGAGGEGEIKIQQSLSHISSVASFFVSRVDSKIDPTLADESLRGKAAIANAKLAYADFQKIFSGERWERLKSHGARLQRPLWASTSTKNPNYPDTMYVDQLIGPHTVDTVPPATLDAFRDHGTAALTLTQNVDEARATLSQLAAAGVSMDAVTQALEDEGVKSFADAFTQLLAAIDERRNSAASSLGPIADSVSSRLSLLDVNSVPACIAKRDASLWTPDPAAQAEVKNRLGWLDSVTDARTRLADYESFAKEIHAQRIERVLVLGMGGSSLTAEVFSSLLAKAEVNAPLSLAILDSTDPIQVALMAEQYPPAESLYIVASKTGGTAEVSAALNYFWSLSHADGSRFVAITDPNTSLETLARERGFRKIFLADPNVGGRFSALTDFGLVPAALLGMDLNQLLDRAEWMSRQCDAHFPAARNPGAALGAVLAESALAGRDKLTLLADAPLAALSAWIEQIVAESAGKAGKGLVPVAFEPLGLVDVYGADRLFVYLRQTGEHDDEIALLRNAGHPVIQSPVPSLSEVGAEFFRWEYAIAVACHILGVNAFDQPNVEDSKARTKAEIAAYKKNGKLDDKDLVDAGHAQAALEKFLADVKPGDFISINAYLPRNKENSAALNHLRVALRAKTKCAVTVGFGPRFQHSTGQMHKGGPNTGHFIQLVADYTEDVQIPEEGLSFGTLIRAQALGDYEALLVSGRKTLRILVNAENAANILTGLLA